MNRILLDCERTKYSNTGLYQFCLELGNALLPLVDNRREELFFYVPEAQKQLFGKTQQYVIQHHLHKFFQRGTGRFAVWHNTYQNSNYRPYSKAVKELITIHDLNFLIEKKAEPGKIRKHLAHVQKNVNRAQHIVCISEFTRKIVTQYLELDARPVHVIYNGCNINEFEGFNQPAYRPVRPFIFSIGRVLPLKNFHVLPCLLKGNDYELVIAGVTDEQYGRKIMEEAKAHGVEKRVRLAGPVSEKDKYWYYAHCLAFAFPSLAEGFGFPLVEAMYYGKPVFVSTHTCLPEIGGDVAYYFESFDCTHMQQVFAGGMQHYSDHLEQQKNRLRERALSFNWHNAATQYLKLYRSLYNH